MQTKITIIPSAKYVTNKMMEIEYWMSNIDALSRWYCDVIIPCVFILWPSSARAVKSKSLLLKRLQLITVDISR